MRLFVNSLLLLIFFEESYCRIPYNRLERIEDNNLPQNYYAAPSSATHRQHRRDQTTDIPSFKNYGFKDEMQIAMAKSLYTNIRRELKKAVNKRLVQITAKYFKEILQLPPPSDLYDYINDDNGNRGEQQRRYEGQAPSMYRPRPENENRQFAQPQPNNQQQYGSAQGSINSKYLNPNSGYDQRQYSNSQQQQQQPAAPRPPGPLPNYGPVGPVINSQVQPANQQQQQPRPNELWRPAPVPLNPNPINYQGQPSGPRPAPVPQPNQGRQYPAPQANQGHQYPAPQANQGHQYPAPQTNQGYQQPAPQARQGPHQHGQAQGEMPRQPHIQG